MGWIGNLTWYIQWFIDVDILSAPGPSPGRSWLGTQMEGPPAERPKKSKECRVHREPAWYQTLEKMNSHGERERGRWILLNLSQFRYVIWNRSNVVKSFEDVNMTGISLVQCGLSYQDVGLNLAEQTGQLSFEHIWLVVWNIFYFPIYWE